MARMTKQHFSAWVAVALLALAAIGCGEAGPNYPHAALSGAITLDDAPVETGRINFIPGSGVAGSPVAADVLDGRYEATEVPLGQLTVTFSLTKATGKMIVEGDREPYPEIISIVPPHYAQGLPLQVTGDNPAQDFHLTTKAAR